MKTRTLIKIIIAATLSFGMAANAQEYANKVVKIIVPSPPGGGTDLIGRLIADKLRVKWNQPVIIENRGGNASNIGAAEVARAAPDGYTLLLTSQGPLVVNKSLFKKLSYDPDTFVPLSLLAKTPSVLLLKAALPATNMQELIDYAKANPGRLNYASQGIGTAAHLATELLASIAGIKLVHVPYVGTSRALLDLVSGEVSMFFGEIANAGPHVRAGKVRIVAVTSEQRSALVPGVPAISETVPGLVFDTWWGMVAPAGTPPGIASQISTDAAWAIKQPDVAKRLLDLSIEDVGGTPADLTQLIKKESELWRKAIRISGATAD